MYTNDLTKMLRMLKERRANDALSTTWTGPGYPWQAQLVLVEGQVTLCQVQSRVDGQSLLTGNEAIRWLASLGELTWEQAAFTPQQPSLPLLRAAQATPPQVAEIPRRLVQGEHTVIHSWSRKQRQVFGLVDGQRSIQRIALILRQPLTLVEDIVHDLQASGVIAVDTLTGEMKAAGGFA